MAGVGVAVGRCPLAGGVALVGVGGFADGDGGGVGGERAGDGLALGVAGALVYRVDAGGDADFCTLPDGLAAVGWNGVGGADVGSVLLAGGGGLDVCSGSLLRRIQSIGAGGADALPVAVVADCWFCGCSLFDGAAWVGGGVAVRADVCGGGDGGVVDLAVRIPDRRRGHRRVLGSGG